MDGLRGAQIERKGEETERHCDLGPDGVAEHGVVLELPSERDGLVDVLPHSIAAPSLIRVLQPSPEPIWPKTLH